jgi:hypothetical protein
MRANRERKFKAPRLLKEKEIARQSDSDEDAIPFSELKEKVRAEGQGSDSEEDNIPFSQLQTKTTKRTGNTRVPMIRMLSEREAYETAEYGEVQKWSADEKAKLVPITQLAESLMKTPQTSRTEKDLESPEKMVGSKIARNFGKRGIFLGEVLGIEYDSEDEDKVGAKHSTTSNSMLNICPYYNL